MKRIFVLFVCFFVFILRQNPLVCETQIEQAERLERLLDGATPQKKLDILLQIIQIQMMIKTRPEKVIHLADNVIGLAEELKDLSSIGYAKIYQAHALAYSKKMDVAQKTMNEAIAIFDKLDNKQGIIEAKYRLGLIYRVDSDYEQALKYFYQALELSDNIQGDKHSIALNYAIGIVNTNLNEHNKALEYYQKALKKAEESNNSEYIAMISNNIGGIYWQRGELAIALEYFQKCLLYFQTSGNEHWIAIVNTNIAGVLRDLNQYDTAISHINEVLAHYRRLHDDVSIAINLKSLSLLFMKKKEYDKAEDNLRQAIELARQHERKSTLLSCYLTYSQLQEELGNFQEALKYLQWYIKLNDEILSEEKNKEISRLQEGFDARNREKEIELLRKTSQIERIRRNALLLGILILFMFLFIIIRRYIHLFTFWKKQKYIGQYRLLETLGLGGMGTVYKAHMVRNRSAIVAIKILKEGLSGREDQKKRFRREGEIIDSLDHPNILKILERGEIDKKLYMVMEYIEGTTLADKIDREGTLSLDICLHIMTQVVNALVFIHEKEIIHRDLKPTNIMLTSKGNDDHFVKLLDFGLSRLATNTRVTQTGMLIGTLDYLAPEQITDGDNSFASDVYALGVIFYEMISGKKFSWGDSFTAITQQIIHIDPPQLDQIRSDVPFQIVRLVTCMMAKDKKQRPQIEEVQKTLIPSVLVNQ